MTCIKGETKVFCFATVNKFCINDLQNIENFYKALNDRTQTWHCHHRFETHNSDGKMRTVELTKEELKALDMYYNRPAEELIFLTPKEHRILHSPFSHVDRKLLPQNTKGHKMSDRVKKRISNGLKGHHWFNNGIIEIFSYKCPEGFSKGRLPFSEEARRHLSEAQKRIRSIAQE